MTCWLGVLLTFTFGGSFISQGETRRWVGNDGNTNWWQADNWFEADNWEPAGIPDASDSVIIETGLVYAATSIHISNLSFGGYSLVVTGDLVVTNFVWTRGQLHGPGRTIIPEGGTLLISGADEKGNGYKTLVNRGELKWIDGGEVYGDITNEGIAELGDGRWYAGTVYNRGLIRKYSLTNGLTHFIGPHVYNFGTIQVDNGRVWLQGDGTNTGTLVINEGASLELTGHDSYRTNHVFLPSTTVRGAGRLTVVTDFLECNGPLSIPCLMLDGGTVTGAETLTVTNLIWRRGRMRGSGRTVIPPTGSIHVTSDSYHDLWRRLENYGNALFEGRMSLDESSFLNFGNIEVRNSYSAFLSAFWRPGPPHAYFNNFGNVTVLGPGEASIHYISCTNFGTIEVLAGRLSVGFESIIQMGGSVRLHQGASLWGGLDVRAGEFGGSGTLLANVVNAGSLSPGNPIGTLLNIGRQEGAFMTNVGTATLNIDIGGTNLTEFDRIVISNSTGWFQLGGRLNISLANGFRPRAGNRFEILRFPYRYGTFDRIDGLNPGGAIQLMPIYSRSNFVLIATNVAMPPNTLMMSRDSKGVRWLSCTGPTNGTYTVEASVDLREWTPILTTNTPTGIVELPVDSEDLYPRRFFRGVGSQ